VLISPDYAPNARAFTMLGFGDSGEGWRESLERLYRSGLEAVRAGRVRRALFVGDGALPATDLDDAFLHGLAQVETSVSITPRAYNPHQEGREVQNFCHVVLPGRTVHEKSGVMVNRDGRFQRLKTLFPPVVGALPDWFVLNRLAESTGKALVGAVDDRSLFRQMVSEVPPFKGLSLMKIGEWGITLEECARQEGHGDVASAAAGTASASNTAGASNEVRG
jgi:NADH dehydrogenase/NADH:ubiquinone oxidoreductase subunit G